MKNVYALQPYQVGSKNGKSLVVLIPAEVAKKYNIDTSTIFTLKGDDKSKTVTLQTVQRLEQNIVYIPDQSLEAVKQISGVK